MAPHNVGHNNNLLPLHGEEVQGIGNLADIIESKTKVNLHHKAHREKLGKHTAILYFPGISF